MKKSFDMKQFYQNILSATTGINLVLFILSGLVAWLLPSGSIDAMIPI
jgi:hypothetical protein